MEIEERESSKEKEKSQTMRKKFRVYGQLKALLEKLVYSTDYELVQR